MTYSIELNKEQINVIIKQYKEYQLPNKTQYMHFFAKINNATLTIYNSNRVVIQGADADNIYQRICTLLNIKAESKSITKTVKPSFNFSIIGSDEVGTGDYFGPIIVCACFVPKDKIIEVRNLGVQDSKKLTDYKIISIAPVLIKSLVHSVVLLNNFKYNEVSKIANMNKVKAIMHNEALSKLVTRNINYDKIIVDGFTDTEKYYQYLDKIKSPVQNVDLVPKGEDKYIAIAAASVIARYHFIKEMDALSQKYNYELPKGAGKPVDEMLSKIIHDDNKDILINIAKLNFNNSKKIKK